MPQVEIISEQELGNAWRFAVQILGDGGDLHRRTMTLAWADYNLWSNDGADAPAKVAEAVLVFLLGKLLPDQLPEKFDASIARRRFADADEDIPRLIGR
jgi:hypothetical protein